MINGTTTGILENMLLSMTAPSATCLLVHQRKAHPQPVYNYSHAAVLKKPKTLKFTLTFEHRHVGEKLWAKWTVVMIKVCHFFLEPPDTGLCAPVFRGSVDSRDLCSSSIGDNATALDCLNSKIDVSHASAFKSTKAFSMRPNMRQSFCGEGLIATAAQATCPEQALCGCFKTSAIRWRCYGKR